MHKMEELRDMLCEELDKITKRGELSSGSLDMVDKLTHSIKSIDTIMAMEDSGYSREGRYYGARGRGSDARRDSRGRYSSRYMYDDGRYSYDGEMEDLKEQLHDMKNMVHDEESKKMIDKWIKQVG